MAKQETLPGVPGPKPRKIVDALESQCLARDKLAGKRTAIGDQVGVASDKIQELLAEHKLDVYTYEDDNGVLQDVVNEVKLKNHKSKLNPKKKKGDE